MMKIEEVEVFDKRNTLMERIADNLITLSLLALCAWVSQGSAWWTLITGLIFIIYFGARANHACSTRRKVFYSKKELQEWVDSLPDDENEE